MKPTKILKKDFKKFKVLNDLYNLADVPDYLYIVGNIALLSSTTLTIIGTRKISSYGEQVIEQVVPQISLSGVCVVSGVAYGCDYYAQKTAVESGGTTIGVMGCGLDHIKTHQHYSFIKHCIDKKIGLFVSEFEPTESAARWTFIKRDRIMAALGKKILVIEASIKSGTMHTVNFALELGKEVYAVPGNIYNSSSLGTNMLIQNGANVMLSADDILDNYDLKVETKDVGQLTQIQIKLMKELKDEKTTVDLSRKLSLPVNLVLSEITVLELKGLIKKVGDKWIAI